METKARVDQGYPPDHCCCDSTWRRLPGGAQGVFLLTENNFAPQPGNSVAHCRSFAAGNTWGNLEPVIRNGAAAVTLFKVVVHTGGITIFR